jgi:geranylgeranyl pyrophosphate synthase
MLVRLALDVATDSQKKRLQLLLGNADINERGIEEFREILRQTAALSTSEQMLQEYVEQGKTAIIKSSLSKESQEYLTAIAEYMALRNH